MCSFFHLIPLPRHFQFLRFHHTFADIIETAWYRCLFSFLYLNFHLVQGMNQCPRMKHSEIYPAGLQFEAFSFILPLEFGTFVWTSIIFNSGIFTFSKSKHVLLKIGRLQLPYGRRDNQTFFFNLKIEADDFSLKMSGDRKLAIYNALLTLPCFVRTNWTSSSSHWK